MALNGAVFQSPDVGHRRPVDGVSFRRLSDAKKAFHDDRQFHRRTSRDSVQSKSGPIETINLIKIPEKKSAAIIHLDYQFPN